MFRLNLIVMSYGSLLFISSVVVASTINPDFAVPYILGGSSAKPAGNHGFPYQILLAIDNVTGTTENELVYCGASLAVVRDIQVVVTAGHCMVEDPADYVIIAGEYDLERVSGFEQKRRVFSYATHHSYKNVPGSQHDIAVVIPDSPFNLSNYVQPITIPNRNYDATGEVTISGWGVNRYVKGTGTNPSILQYITTHLVSPESCNAIWDKYYLGNNKISSTQLCGISPFGETGACLGDSGGPVAQDNMLVGIVSYGLECGHPIYPEVYTEVAKYADWLEDTVTILKGEYSIQSQVKQKQQQ